MTLPEIRASRVLLRPWSDDDVDALHALWTRPEVRRYLWDDIVIGRETAEQAVQSHFDTVERLGIGYWTIQILRTDGVPELSMTGFCGFRPMDDSAEIELMYGLGGEYWGQGLATEASAAALDFLWRSTGYARVHARCDLLNVSSIRVMERLGMTHVSSTPTLVTYLLGRPAALLRARVL